MCLRNKTPKIRAILKLSGICLSYLYGCVAKWVRDDHTNTVHILILYSAILYSLWRLGIPSNWWLPHQGYDCRYIILWQMVSSLYEVCYNGQLRSKKDQGHEQQDRVRLWSGNIWEGSGGKSTKCSLCISLGKRFGSEDKMGPFQSPVSSHFPTDALPPLNALKKSEPNTLVKKQAMHTQKE